MKTSRAVIIQCRLSSTRLPGKAIMDLGGFPVLAWALKSMKKVPADYYYVATDFDSYDALKPICEANGFQIFAGDLNDVLKRFCDLIKTLDVKTIIRGTADNPFLFYEAAEESVKDFEEYNKGKFHCDYLTYSGLPHGSGVEIFSAEALLKAAEQTSDPYDHEHVGPALYKHTDKFKCNFVKAPRRYNHPELRTTIDTYSDYLRAIQVVNYLGINNAPYTTEEILEAMKSKSVQTPVILAPSVVKGHGTGHLRRCLEAAIGKPFFVYIPEDNTLEETDSLLEEYKLKGFKASQIITALPDCTYPPIIISDSFELTKEDLEKFSINKGIISIDEGSEYHQHCDYLLDIIPSLKTTRKANLTDSAFIQKPENVRKTEVDSKNINNILVCLGGEDPAGLTIPCCNAISQCYPKAKITAVTKNEERQEENVAYVKPIANLKEQLCNYDLVFTHYGLTAFEAAFAGCGVILLPTSPLHVQLAKKYNFAFIEETKITVNSIVQAVTSPNLIPGQDNNCHNESLSDFIENLSTGQKLVCPVCDKAPITPDEIVSRNETRTYRRCRNCSMVYIQWTVEPDKKYQKSYFFDEYKKQYGKTYQEDFESIKEQGKRRISEIKSIYGNLKDKNTLDIGCAYGPFLSAAADSGLNPFGTDISDDAVSYVQSELHFPASSSKFPEINVEEEFGVQQFDIVTMWYVIEHFKNLDEVLRKVSAITKKGGIFAFSTPSGQGISAVSDADHFYTISPTDHYTVWEPSKANKILKKYGFQVEKIVSTGHHPERFPSVKAKDIKKGSVRWNLIDKLSRVRKLGDTVEIYAKKIK